MAQGDDTTGYTAAKGSAPQRGADPKSSRLVMISTYLVGGIGLATGFGTVHQTPAELSLTCLLSVGAVGVLSFVRHSLMHRSDAARMGWDYGVRNNFQIEVGIANLAWGIVAILAVILGWGLAVESALVLTLGIYITSVALMKAFISGGQSRQLGPILGASAFGLALLYLGILGMAAAT
jgi:hypothetical protein